MLVVTPQKGAAEPSPPGSAARGSPSHSCSGTAGAAHASAACFRSPPAVTPRPSPSARASLPGHSPGRRNERGGVLRLPSEAAARGSRCAAVAEAGGGRSGSAA